MLGMNYLAVVVTAVAAIATSSVWYIVFGKARIELLGKEPGASVDTTKPQPARMAVEIVRTLVVTCVLAHFVVLLGITGWISAVKLGLWLWIGFPFMILVGSVLWDTTGRLFARTSRSSARGLLQSPNGKRTRASKPGWEPRFAILSSPTTTRERRCAAWAACRC